MERADPHRNCRPACRQRARQSQDHQCL